MRHDQRPQTATHAELIDLLDATADAAPPAPRAPSTFRALGTELLLCSYFLLSC
jgi:hypothetical protein